MDSDLAAIAAAAGAALSRALGRPVQLGEIERLTEPGRRNVVLRGRNLSGGEPASVVVKQVVAERYDPENFASWDVRRFLTDWAGAEFLSTLPGPALPSPRFYAGDRERGLFVLEDLGPHRSLVEPLLQADAASAEQALFALVTALGRLHAAARGQQARLERLCRDLSPGLTGGSSSSSFEERLKRVLATLEQLGIAQPAALSHDLETVRAIVESPGPFLTYIHGDPCPDNLFFTAGRVRFIDFEFGRFGHALLDAAYGRMLFPTCWCANRLPPALIPRLEAAYRAELVTGCPEAQDDRVFETALLQVCAFWLLDTLGWLLDGALKEDRRWGIAGVRTRLLARLDVFLTMPGAAALLPGVSELAERLHRTLNERWPEAPPLPLYPAFQLAGGAVEG